MRTSAADAPTQATAPVEIVHLLVGAGLPTFCREVDEGSSALAAPRRAPPFWTWRSGGITTTLMPRPLQVRRADVSLVSIGPPQCAPQVIGHEHLGYPIANRHPVGRGWEPDDQLG